MRYVPKKRGLKIRWKVAGPLLLLIALILYALFSLVLPDQKAQEKKFTVCNLSEKKTVELLNKKVGQTFAVKDYTVYGESLGLYSDTYTPELEDQVSGKTMQLHNVCTNKTETLTIDSDIDQKITLNDLEAGFYEISVIDNLIEKRLVYDKVLDVAPFYTAKRDNQVKEVTMLANKDLLKDYDIAWNENYLFLNVENKKPASDKIDVYLDPYGMSTDFQYVPDEGNRGNGLSEYQETYDAALIMKKQLESHGLRVEISRKDAKSTTAKAYGKDGRFAQAYQKDAKYYIVLRMNKSENTNLRGVEIWHSSYVSDMIGTNLIFGLEKNLDIAKSTYVNGDGSGVGPSARDKTYYDNNLYLRETGGKSTFTAMYSDTAKEENIDFKNANGMYALELDFAYVSNSEDASYWKENKEKIAKQCADSFAQAIGVSVK